MRVRAASARNERLSLIAAVGLFAVVAAAHYAGSELAIQVNRETNQGVSVFPSAGVTVAALLLVRRNAWWIVLTATMAAEYGANRFLIHEVFGTAFGSALSNVVEPWLGAAVVLHWLGHTPMMQRTRDLVAFIGGAVICGPVLGTLVGVTSTRFTRDHSAFFDVAGRWFVGDALGVLVVGSLILAWARTDGSIRRSVSSAVEALVLTVVLLGVSWYAFWGTIPALAYATLPVLGWAALRFRAVGATTGGAIVAALADWATLTGHGLFHALNKNHRDAALWQLQLFLGVVILTSMMLAAQVSEFETTARALRQAEATKRFQLLLEASPDPVVIVRFDGSIEYVNREFELLTHRASADLLGVDWTTVLPELAREGAQRRFDEAWRSAQGGRMSFELEDVGGTGRLFDVAVSPMRWQDSKVFVGMMREVTERRRAEQATLHALAAAEQATRAKSEFLAMMSHEIRTPMNGVIGMVDILGRMSLEAEQRQIVGTIAESADALLAVLNDILDFSKIEAGKLTIESAPFELRDLVDGVVEVMASTAASKSVELGCVVAEDVPLYVLGDAVRLRQIVYNLLGNAVKFTTAGSVSLSVKAAKPGIELVVTDTGIGMTDEQRQRLFEPFVQAEQSTTRRFGGSGLGLSIVTRLAELMGGSIEVDSAPGAGSTFTVRLPIAAAEPPADLEKPLPGVRVRIVASASPSESVGVAAHALRLAGADVHVVDADPVDAIAAQAGRDYDVLYVTRDARLQVDDHRLDEVVLDAAPYTAVIADRTVDGTTWLPHATPLSTSAHTGRAVVRAVALATGRAPAHEVAAANGATSTPQPGMPTVLVAEDHPTNRIVIRRQLSLLGIPCDLAADGEEALQMLAEGEYALLLADCHMPRLDGYELTRRIRRAEADDGAHLPIIALTASALPSETDRCLDAGMDLVLTKPVALEALDRALAPWLHPDGHEDVAPTEAASTASSAGIVDLSLLRDMFGDDPSAIDDVTASFVRSSTETLSQLDAAEAANDAAGMRSAAHRLLGGARTLGASRLVAVCERIESAEDVPDSALLDELRSELKAVTASLTASGGAPR